VRGTRPFMTIMSQNSQSARMEEHDLHFRITGPVVAQLQEAFADDWAFCTGELLQGELWFSVVEPDGPPLASTGTWLSCVALASPVRPHQAAAG
jgi:phosphatidylserine/phosphatidylglycerophosphate/cardiolipin synthase-like enzyme